MKLSSSHLTCYLKCPQLYYFLYIQKRFPHISDKAYYGTLMHSALEKWFNLSNEHNTPQMFIDDIAPLNKETLLSFIQNHSLAKKLTNMDIPQTLEYLWNFIQNYNNIDTHYIHEKSFAVPYAGITLTGRIDQIHEDTDGNSICEWKSREIHNKKDIPLEFLLQLQCYNIASKHLWTQPVQKFILGSIKGKKLFSFSPEELEAACPESTVKNIIEKIQNQDFGKTIDYCKHCAFDKECHPNPTNFE